MSKFEKIILALHVTMCLGLKNRNCVCCVVLCLDWSCECSIEITQNLDVFVSYCSLSFCFRLKQDPKT